MSESGARISPSSLVCVSCGYNLTGATIGGACPECGTPIQDTLDRKQELKVCGTATASMILGIVSLIICGAIGPVAIGLYFKAMREIRRGGYAAASRTMAFVGLVTGLLSTLLLLGTLALMFFN